MVKKMVIVVGAGASKEINLPTGDELKRRIAQLLGFQTDGFEISSGDRLILRAIQDEIRKNSRDEREQFKYIDAANAIRDAIGQAISIDHFIDAHHGNERIELCGKLAITRIINEAERRSSIFFEHKTQKDTIKFENCEETYLPLLFRMIHEQCSINNLEKRLAGVNFIIFNYDRTVEHYLFHAIQNYYRIERRIAAEIVRSIEIHHPYGTVGTLPWYDDQLPVEYGGSISSDNLLNVAKGIKTFTEGTDTNTSQINKIKEIIGRSETILFLGFAFHKLNMGLLSPKIDMMSLLQERQIIATAFGVSKNNCELIKSEMANLFHCPERNIEIRNDLSCRAIFSEYSRRLSMV